MPPPPFLLFSQPLNKLMTITPVIELFMDPSDAAAV